MSSRSVIRADHNIAWLGKTGPDKEEMNTMFKKLLDLAKITVAWAGRAYTGLGPKSAKWKRVGRTQIYVRKSWLIRDHPSVIKRFNTQ